MVDTSSTAPDDESGPATLLDVRADEDEAATDNSAPIIVQLVLNPLMTIAHFRHF